MTPQEAQHIEQYTAGPTTRCVGRYLIDLPEAFVQNSESKGATVEGVNIVDVKPMNREQFKRSLADRESELRRMHMDGRPDRPFLKTSTPLAPALSQGTSTTDIGVVFDHAESTGSAEFGRVLELLGWKDGFLIDMRIKATDGTGMQLDPSVIGTPFEASEKKILSEYQSRKDTPEKLAHLLDVYQRVRGRPNNEIPTERGFCFMNGFVEGPAVEEEVMGDLFDLKGSSDVYFKFTESGNLHEQTTLLQRSDQVEKEMALSGTKTIRKGRRQVHQLPYEEWLMRGPTPDRVPGTMFSIHGNEVAEGADKPFVELEMFNGFRVIQPPNLSDQQKERLGLYKELERATLTETEAIAIWEKVTATLRPRPGAF